MIDTSFIVIISLLIFIIVREYMNYVERRELTNKIMSRTYNDYYEGQATLMREKATQKEPYSVPL